jgi:hypothetical protein
VRAAVAGERIVGATSYERLRKAVDAEEIDPSFFEIDDFEPARDNPQ